MALGDIIQNKPLSQRLVEAERIHTSELHPSGFYSIFRLASSGLLTNDQVVQISSRLQILIDHNLKTKLLEAKIIILDKKNDKNFFINGSYLNTLLSDQWNSQIQGVLEEIETRLDGISKNIKIEEDTESTLDRIYKEIEKIIEQTRGQQQLSDKEFGSFISNSLFLDKPSALKTLFNFLKKVNNIELSVQQQTELNTLIQES